MPVQQSKLLSELKGKSKGGWKKSKGKEARPKGQQLPDGLVNAKGRVIGYKLDKYDDGTPYLSFQCVGVVPNSIEGQRFAITIRLKADENRKVPKTFQDCLDDVSNTMKLLGAERYESWENADDIDAWPEICEALVADKVLFVFNTRAWALNGRTGVSVNVQGPATDDDPDQNTEVEPDAEAAGTEEEPEAEADGAIDLDALDRSGLKALIKEREIDFTVNKGHSDDDIREAIREALNGELSAEEEEPEPEVEEEPEPEAESEEEPFVPEKEMTYGYKPPKTKKVINVTVTKVDTKKKTAEAHLENDKKKVYKGIPFDAFVDAV